LAPRTATEATSKYMIASFGLVVGDMVTLKRELFDTGAVTRVLIRRSLF